MQAMIENNLELKKLKDANEMLKNSLDQAKLELELRNKELIETKRIADEYVKLKEAFLSNLSHEFRTPLTSIYGSADLLNSSITPQSLKPELLEVIIYNSEKLIRQFENIVEVSLLDSTKVELKIDRHDLRSLFEDLKKFALKKTKHYDKQHLEIYFSSDQNIDGKYIYTDINKVRKMFENLIDNAIKFTENGHVKYGCKSKEGDKIKFFVDDTGIGIDKSMHPYIFDTFRKEEQIRDKLYEGIGLGLTIFKGYLKLLNGSYIIKSSTSKGTYIRFTL